MSKEIIIAVVSSILGALIAFLASSSFGLFEKNVSDTQVQDIAKMIVDTESHRAVILNKMDESGEFKGPIGIQGVTGPQGKTGPEGPGINALAILRVKYGSVEYSSPGVSYDRASGVVTFPNPNNLKVLPLISDFGDTYMTEKHYIRQDFPMSNMFKVWKTPLDTGDRNSAPTSFTAIAIGL